MTSTIHYNIDTMIQYLEELLYNKTKDKQSSILFAQWNYDKRVIPTALQTVSNLFPHYSLHDESHSITIINNIVRVLGKQNIEKLSAIDIWLILEASYSHDIGMAVSSEVQIKSLKSPEFIAFFKDLIQDKKSGLHEFAVQFEVVDGKIKYSKDELNLELHDGIKFILAEYFRRVHADRSKAIINDPSSELALSSPRGVIPNRIFKILGDICASHTKDFAKVLELPFCEVGIDMEDAHPRFISCLLRIGDLLDLDNNRFSEVMLRTLSKIPIDTLNHKAKHLSIQSFRVDKEVIEIEANCKDYETANITQHWFNYLNSEISNQMIAWNKIVPSKDLGYLPTIGNLKVELVGYDYIDGKNKPKFSVDTDKALGLLQGAGLYDGAYQCMREILQNSVDATLLRIWLEHKDEMDFSSPHSVDFEKLMKETAVSISITEKEVDGEWKKWTIVVEDRGTGISSNDLTFLMNTGSSSKNKSRTSIIDSMPRWMAPSGTFGIGFQSIFMLTNMVTIETKSFFDEQYQIIELNSPNSPKDGDILIRKKATTHAIKPGTRIILDHKTKAIPSRYTVSMSQGNASRIAHNYDPFSHESLDIELGKILDEIFDYASKSYIPIRLKVNNTEISTASPIADKFDYFEPGNSMELSFHPVDLLRNWRNRTYYKNQYVDNSLLIKFLSLDINLHRDKASEVLTLNRNKIKDEYGKELWNQLLKSAFIIIIEHFETIFKSQQEKAIGSMFLQYYSKSESVSDLDVSSFEQWKEIELNVGSKSVKMGSLLQSINKLKLVYRRTKSTDPMIITDEFTLSGKTLTITVRGGGPSLDYTTFFLFKAQDYFTSFEKISENDLADREVVFTKSPQLNPFSFKELVELITSTANGFYSSRVIIPCLVEYFDLRVKNDAFEPYVYHYVLDSNIYLPYPRMLSPYVTIEKPDRTRELQLCLPEKAIDWVYANRYNSAVTIEQVREGYKKFTHNINLEKINESLKQVKTVEW